MMQYKTLLYRLAIVVICFLSFSKLSYAQYAKDYPDSVKVSISTIDYYLQHYEQWYPQNYQLSREIRSLLHYVKDEQVDTVVSRLAKYRNTEDTNYFFRTLDNVQDSLSAPGYIPYELVVEEKAKINRNVRDAIQLDLIEVPTELIQEAQSSVKLIPEEGAYRLLEIGYSTLPDSLQDVRDGEAAEDISNEEFQRLQRLEASKYRFLESERMRYNAEILQNASDSISTVYREQVVLAESEKQQSAYVDSIKTHNTEMLYAYNKQVEKQVNDTIDSSLRILINHVNSEQLSFWLHNTTEDSVEVKLSNNFNSTSRIFIKNLQQDSLGVRVFGNSRNSIKLFIDDGVTLTRFKERKHRDYQFRKVNVKDDLYDVKQKYEIVTPWTYGATFNMAFTQIYLENWVKGGETSLSVLMTLKAYANYSLDKVEWENSVNIRSGWLNPSDGGMQKSEDDFEFVSNLGLQAYNKWYYSLELTTETQLFNSYNYPDRDNPTSGFIAPLKTYLKLGMEYKNKDNLSVLASPITMKSVFVRDTAVYDQTQFGVDEGSKSFWDVGLNIDLTYKKQVLDGFSVTSAYKMFIDYQDIFQQLDIDWENTFDMQINNYMKAQLILHLLYDDNVTFDTGRVDAYGDAIYKAKWQFKEFVTIGFVYSLDRNKKRRRKIQ